MFYKNILYVVLIITQLCRRPDIVIVKYDRKFLFVLLFLYFLKNIALDNL